MPLRTSDGRLRDLRQSVRNNCVIDDIGLTGVPHPSKLVDGGVDHVRARGMTNDRTIVTPIPEMLKLPQGGSAWRSCSGISLSAYEL